MTRAYGCSERIDEATETAAPGTDETGPKARRRTITAVTGRILIAELSECSDRKVAQEDRSRIAVGPRIRVWKSGETR